jgi:gluconolactonase
VLPHAGTDAGDEYWRPLDPPDLQQRLSTGRVCFNWYRTSVTIPARVADLDPTGLIAIFEIVIDDYAEVWVNGQLRKTLGDVGGQVVAGFNAPNRVVLTDDALPGQTFDLEVLGINGPISASPSNFIWVRSATLEFHRVPVTEPVPAAVLRQDPRLAEVAPEPLVAERIATGFEFTEGPVWSDGGLLFSSPNTNAIYRWASPGQVTVFRPKSGYTGPDPTV